MKSVLETLQTIGGKNYNPAIPSIPQQESICRTYNNVYGLINGTRMYCATPGGYNTPLASVYIIQGTALSNSNKEEFLTYFLYSAVYGTKALKPDGITNMSLAQWLRKYGMCVDTDEVKELSKYNIPTENLPKDKDYMIIAPCEIVFPLEGEQLNTPKVM